MERGHFTTSHSIFIDDLKIYAKSEENLEKTVKEAKNFFEKVGLEMNKEKSATNSPKCTEHAVFLEGVEGYKYLGIMQDSNSKLNKETFNKIK